MTERGWQSGSGPTAPDPKRAVPFALLCAAFVALGIVLQLPAVHGSFFSDDRSYIVDNPYVRDPSLPHLREILDPTSDLTLNVANYAPTHLLTHVVQYQLFGLDPLGYRLTNAVLHGVASALLVPLLMASGVAALPAVLGGLLFLVHTANLEVLAWASQVKTLLAMVFMLIALLLAGRHPVLSTVAFALALTSKAMAVVALPVAAILEWTRRGRRRGGAAGRPGGRGYLSAWALICGLFLLSQFSAFQHANAGVHPVSESFVTRIWSSASIGAHYLATAATTLGVAMWHEPEPVTSPLDPWVLAAFGATFLLTWRTAWALRRRREEAAWWIWAAGSYVPVAQVFPFLYPMADRYLYFILPGLIGGVILAGRDALAWLASDQRAPSSRALAVAGLVVCCVFAVRTWERAHIWSSEERIMADTVAHYPRSSTARYFRARGAVRRGHYAVAVEHLRAATEEGRTRELGHLLLDPSLAPLRGRPDFNALVEDRIEERMERVRRLEYPTDSELILLGSAYLSVGRVEEAVELWEQVAAREESAFGEEVREQLRRLRARTGRPPPPPAASSPAP